MQHVMVDIETLGIKPGSVILSIGAIDFDPHTGALGEGFYVNIDRELSKAAGLTTDTSTVNWWASQGKEATQALLDDCKPPGTAHRTFFDWFRNVGGKYIWSHGVNFDVVLIEAVVQKLGGSVPWKFYNTRDTRTIYDVAAVTPDRAKGVHHFALDDAKRQAEAVIKSYKVLKP